jgi:hypothetical protein
MARRVAHDCWQAGGPMRTFPWTLVAITIGIVATATALKIPDDAHRPWWDYVFYGGLGILILTAILLLFSREKPTPTRSAKSKGENSDGTAGTNGTLNINPEAQTRADNTIAIDAIALLIREGQQISRTFEQTNNIEQIRDQYEHWRLAVENKFGEIFEKPKSYLIRFQSAPWSRSGRDGMAFKGTGYWQHLNGQIKILHSLLAELMR